MARVFTPPCRRRRRATTQMSPTKTPHNVADAAVAAAAAEQDAKVAKLPQMIGLVWSDDDDYRREGTLGIWELLSAEGGSGLFHQVEKSGAAGRLVEFLDIDYSPNLQFVAACVISTIASSENTLAVVKHGAVPNLLKLLHSTVDTNREKAVEALGEIAHGDSPDCRETLLSSGAFEALLPHLSEDAESSMVKIAIRALPKFWSAKPILSFCQTELVVDVIQRLIGSSDDELVSEACWALFHITHESKDNLGGNNVNGMCICHMLVKLLGHRNQSVLYPVLQAAIVLPAGDEFHVQRMINYKVLPRLVNLLTNDYEMRIKNDACWVIWNITISDWQKEAVVASGAISALVNLLQNPEFDTKKKAAWAITNVTYEASKDRIKFLVDEGCIIPLCNLLDSRDQESLKVCLQGLENILKAGEYKNLGSSGDDNVYAHKIKEAAGVRMMRKLLNGDGDEIHQMAARILEEYF